MATNRDFSDRSCGSSGAVPERGSNELPTAAEVEQRLQELSDLYELGKSLREVRFVDRPRDSAADRRRKRPDDRG